MSADSHVHNPLMSGIIQRLMYLKFEFEDLCNIYPLNFKFSTKIVVHDFLAFLPPISYHVQQFIRGNSQIDSENTGFNSMENFGTYIFFLILAFGAGLLIRDIWSSVFKQWQHFAN